MATTTNYGAGSVSTIPNQPNPTLNTNNMISTATGPSQGSITYSNNQQSTQNVAPMTPITTTPTTPAQQTNQPTTVQEPVTNIAPTSKPKTTTPKTTTQQTSQQPSPMAPLQKPDVIQTVSNNFRDKIRQQVASGIPLDNATRDELFNQAIKDIGGEFDINNPNAENIRSIIYNNALLGLQAKNWDDYYGRSINNIQRTERIMNIPSSEIAKRLSSGELKYRDISVLNKMNPQKLQEIFALKRQNDEMKNMNSMISGETIKATTDLPTIDQTAAEQGVVVDMEDQGLLGIYDSMMSDPNIEAAKGPLDDINKKVAELQSKKQTLYKELSKKITDKSILDAAYRDQAESLNLELLPLLSQQEIYSENYQSAIQDAKDRFSIYVKDQELQSDRKQKEFDNFLKLRQIGISEAELGLRQQESIAKQVADLGGYIDSNGNFVVVDTTINDSTVSPISVGAQQGWLGSVGNGNVTNLSNSIDIDGNIGDPLSLPFDATVINAGIEASTGNKYVTVQTPDGKVLQFNHLDNFGDGMQSVQYNPGDSIAAGQVFATIGNSGDVKDAKGNWLRRGGVEYNPQAIQQGLGSHLDFRGWNSINDYNNRGDGTRNQMDFNSLARYMNGGGLQTEGPKFLTQEQIGYLTARLKGTLPTGIKAGTRQAQQFMNNSDKFYTDFLQQIGPYKDYIDALQSGTSLGGNVSDADANRIFNTAYEAALNGDEEKLKQRFKDLVLSKEGGKDFLTLSLSLKTLDRIEQGLNKIDTGPIKGNVEKIAQKFGQTSNPELAELGNLISLFNNKYVLDLAGTTFTDNYLQRISSQLASIKNSKELNDTIIKPLKQHLQDTIDIWAAPRMGSRAVFEKVFLDNTANEQINQVNSPVLTGRPRIRGQ